MAGFRAFQEQMVTSNPERDWMSFDQVYYDTFEARRVRYDILWSLYESTVYRNVHEWAVTYKTRFALYKYIRSIYNPSYRLGEFWKSHLWGGHLDPMAGDTGALPIITEQAAEPLRAAIAAVWLESNFALAKDVWTLKGAVMGDTIVRVVDDVLKGSVYFEQLSPSSIAELITDEMGNVQGYTLVKQVEYNGRWVEFKETCERTDTMDILYKTYLNDTQFDWGNGAEWVEPYGFVPMVHIQHNDIGGGFGWSELHPMRSKLHEVDDIASMLSDQIRKGINPKWLFAGVKKDDNGKVNRTADRATTDRPEPGREQQQALYSTDANAKAHALVADIDIIGALEHITGIVKEIERDYPELRFDNLRTSGEVSGEALRVARKPAETKVGQRRANYDAGLVKLNQMAVSIGGMRSYFPFSLDSYEAGALDHHIGERPVFRSDKIDDLQEEQLFWQAAKAAVDAGFSLTAWLKRQDWTDKEIAELINSPEYKAKQSLVDNLTNVSSTTPQSNQNSPNGQ